MALSDCWNNCTYSDSGAGVVNVAKIQCAECVFMAILNVILRAAGIAAFILIIIGGFNWITSGGDPKKLQTAKNMITYAIAGLVLMLLAWFVMLFIQKFTGVDVTNFTLNIT